MGRRTGGNAKTIVWICANGILTLCLVLVVAGYLMPWYSGTDVFLLDAWSWIAEGYQGFMPKLGFIMIVCFMATVSALALVIFAIWSKRRRGQMLRASSYLISFAIAAPLIRVQTLLGPDPEWQYLWDGIMRMDVGWYLAMSFGLYAYVLAVIMYHWRQGQDKDAFSSSAPEVNGFMPIGPSLILIALFVSGVFVTVIGYSEVWTSGTFFTVHGPQVVSKTGVDEAPLMCLVPMLAVSSLVVAPFGLLLWRRAGPALLLTAQCLLVTGCALTVFWGVTVGEWIMRYRGYSGEFELQPAWYIVVLGQALAIVSLVFFGRLRTRKAFRTD